MDLLSSLEPQISALLQRHREATARTDWSYHEFLPLEAYHSERTRRTPLSDVAYTAVETALLTEVILPWYTSALCRRLDNASASLAEFVRQWTSEEDQHSTLLETYLLITANGDHAKRNAIRKLVLARGWYDDVADPFEAVVYTSLQEMATRSFYVHTAQTCAPEEPMLARALRRISKDETLHMMFYRDVVKAHLQVEPDYVGPVARVVLRFQMPGNSVLPDARERGVYLTQNKVWGPEQFRQDVVEDLCSYWEIDRLKPRLPTATRMQLRLLKFREGLRRLSERSIRAAGLVRQEGESNDDK